MTTARQQRIAACRAADHWPPVSAATACSSGPARTPARSRRQGRSTLTFWTWAPNMDKSSTPGTPPTPTSRSPSASRPAATTSSPSSSPRQGRQPARPGPGRVPDAADPVSNDALADITARSSRPRASSPRASGTLVTLGTDAVYALPQDSGPMMLYYRDDLFKQYGLDGPRRPGTSTPRRPAPCAQKDPKQLPRPRSPPTTRAGSPASPSRPAASGGAINGDAWKVAINDAATKKVADYWGGLVQRGRHRRPADVHPASGTRRLNDGTLLAWPSAVWAPGVLPATRPTTKGKWAIAPLPQWSAGENADRHLGRLVHRGRRRSPSTRRRRRSSPPG